MWAPVLPFITEWRSIYPALWILTQVPFVCVHNWFLLWFFNYFLILFKSLLAIFTNGWLLLLISNNRMVRSPMWSAFALYVFKSSIWMSPGLRIFLTVSHGPSLVGFGVFCSFQVQIDYEHAGSYWPSCFVSHIPKLLISSTAWLQLLDFTGLECLNSTLLAYSWSTMSDAKSSLFSIQNRVWCGWKKPWIYSVALCGLPTLLCSSLSQLSEFWSPLRTLVQVVMLLLPSVLTSIKEMHGFVSPVFKGMACSNSFGEAASSCAPPSCLFFKVALLCSWIYLIGFLLERNSRAAFAN